MARINIENSIYQDLRFLNLTRKLNSVEEAIGSLVRAWTLAQTWYVKGSKLIPLSEWQKHQIRNEIIDVGLAQIIDGHVRVCGAEEQFAWLAQRVEAGRKGGLSKGKRSLAVAKRVEAVAKPPTPTPTPTLSPSSPSNSSSRSKKKRDGTPSESATAQALIAGYCERFKARWGINPEIRGKEAGIARRLSNDLSSDKVELYLDAFFHIPDAWLVKAKHPLSALETKLNEVAVFASSGKFTTNKQAHQADDMATNALLLQQVRDGKI